ncbi:hypothetical protein BS50DRAFT_630935 [Corynespora cassiicola Philippines]|uniref:Uncharacterized protein n=1 Tax=Corynespora cassiicola Philippines TaxID=1448308 RepID=A0A2T2NZP8_CORCC|nr:hypothetical protein BS50DRAFT_630935 [Corynespora cassiicola Philippines]
MPRDRQPQALGPNAPDRNLELPEWGNITGAEILAFCPNWIRSCDITFRLVTNGLRSQIAAQIINHYRRLPGKPLAANTMCKILTMVMRNSGFDGWKVGLHHRFVPHDWDGCKMSLKDYKLECDEFPDRQPCRSGKIMAMAFKDLMKDVINIPSGNDALDLTRCVVYAANNPNEDWDFPTDFERLVNHLGGITPISENNHDNVIFQRWEDGNFSGFTPDPAGPIPTPCPPPSNACKTKAKANGSKRKTFDKKKTEDSKNKVTKRNAPATRNASAGRPVLEAALQEAKDPRHHSAESSDVAFTHSPVLNVPVFLPTSIREPPLMANNTSVYGLPPYPTAMDLSNIEYNGGFHAAYYPQHNNPYYGGDMMPYNTVHNTVPTAQLASTYPYGLGNFGMEQHDDMLAQGCSDVGSFNFNTGYGYFGQGGYANFDGSIDPSIL